MRTAVRETEVLRGTSLERKLRRRRRRRQRFSKRAGMSLYETMTASQK